MTEPRSPSSPVPSSEPEDFDELLDEFRRQEQWIATHAERKDFVSAEIARAKAETARLSLQSYVSRLREEREAAMLDLAERLHSAESQLSRIQQTGLTAEEAARLLRVFEAFSFPDLPKFYAVIEKLRSLAALRSLEGDRGKQEQKHEG